MTSALDEQIERVRLEGVKEGRLFDCYIKSNASRIDMVENHIAKAMKLALVENMYRLIVKIVPVIILSHLMKIDIILF